MAEADRALFASARDALTFALNFEDTSIPGPIMNREMALPQLDKARAEAQARAYTGAARRASPTTMVKKHVPLGGTQDRAILAGWILQRFLHLNTVMRLVLTLTVQKPRVICTCGAPCCRGWTLKLQWVESVRILVQHLKEQAESEREPGKRGFSSEPRLRQALIEDFARPESKRWSLARLSELAEVSTTTAAAHRARIHGYLGDVEAQAWGELAAIFDAHGITGVVPD